MVFSVNKPYTPENASNFFVFQVDNLAESSMYKIKVYAINSKGKSDQTWIHAQTLRKAEKYTYTNTTATISDESNLLFSNYTLSHIKIIMLSLCGFLILSLVLIVTAITYMSRLCQLIRRKRLKPNEDTSEEVNTESNNTNDNYTLDNLGIQTVYTETNDAICSEYYNNLLTQYSPKEHGNLEMLSLDLYNINKGPPDLIPTFYYNSMENSGMLTINT